MPSPPLHLAGTGCCLMDYLYTRVDFHSPVFQRALSRTPGDGGLRPGALVFAEDFERFVGRCFPDWLTDLTGGRPPDAENLGGPAIVALIHAAQMLYDRGVRVSFHAGHGNDEGGGKMRTLIRRTPVATHGYRKLDGPSPSTVVLSDPSYHQGQGERTFINTLGAASAYAPEMLEDTFFDADICLYGATAIVPGLHDDLHGLLARSREQGAVNVVGTVYDFRHEQQGPERPWPLGDTERSLPLIDLLVCDLEEAQRISGCDTAVSAIKRFLHAGVGSAVVTEGAAPIHLASRGGVFAEQPTRTLPVSRAVSRDLRTRGTGEAGDTTGCGDNFLGGVLTSLCLQWLEGRRQGLDLGDACAWGAASGGFACFYKGGTFMETRPGEKREQVIPYYQDYLEQIRSAG